MSIPSNTAIIIVGAGKTGITLAKEAARYLNASNNHVSLAIYDKGKVTKRDTTEGFFIPDDVGEYRSATVQMVLAEAYPELKITAYGKLEKNTTMPTGMFSLYGQRHAIICDCSGGKAREEIASLIMNSTAVQTYLLEPCKDGLCVMDFTKTQKKAGTKLVDEDTLKEGFRADRNSQKLRTAYLMLSAICSMAEDKIQKKIVWNADTLSYCYESSFPVLDEREIASIPVRLKNKKISLVCIGAGGTGGNIIKELLPYMLKNKNLTLTIVDGDRVEHKNLERQAFQERDILQNKAETTVEKIGTQYPQLKERVKAVGRYINVLPEMDLFEDGYPVLIGAVDNHRARQIFVQWMEAVENGIWIDSANEFSYGECVVSIKENGVLYSPMRSELFPEVLTDNSPSATELSCGAVNITSPQHQVTNLIAGMVVLSVLETLTEKGRITGGMVAFDSLTSDGIFSRYQPMYHRMEKNPPEKEVRHAKRKTTAGA